MRQLKRFCAATLLSLAIAITAFAGDVQAPANPQPPGGIPAPVVTTPEPGDVSTPGSSDTDILTEVTIELYGLIFSIF